MTGLPPVLVLVLPCPTAAPWNLPNKWLIFKYLSPFLHLVEETLRHACCPWVILKRAFFVSGFSPYGWIDRQLIVILAIIYQDVSLLDSTAENITCISRVSLEPTVLNSPSLPLLAVFQETDNWSILVTPEVTPGFSTHLSVFPQHSICISFTELSILHYNDNLHICLFHLIVSSSRSKDIGLFIFQFPECNSTCNV